VEIRTEEAAPEAIKVEVPSIKPEISYEEFEKVDLRPPKTGAKIR
jgi:hypothetical protein